MPLDPVDRLDQGNRYFGVYAGVVADRDDPKGIGRIRVRIPGMHEPAGPWALPLGTGGAAKNVGQWWIPPTGAEVAVCFHRGNPDRPYYLAGNWTLGNVPEEAKGPTGKGDPDVYVLASSDFAVVMDERAATKGMKLLHRPSGDVLEYDGLLRQWTLRATTAVKIESVGQIDIQGLAVTINGRPVLPINQPI